MVTKTHQYWDKNHALLLAVVIILLVGVSFVVFGPPHVFRSSSGQTSHSKQPTTNTPETKGDVAQPHPASNNSSSSVQNNATQPGDQKNQTAGSTGSGLLAPTGTFVSDHSPNLSGSPHPNILNSSCTTTPGATCQIVFTKNGTTKSLPSQATDRGGSAYWNAWTLQQIGLTAGSWQVSAVATVNGQSKTSYDAQALEVSP